MIRVKVCGITRPADAIAAAEAGADAIGLVFAHSPRRVSVDQAKAILAILPPFVTPVALFVNESLARVQAVCAELGVHTVQLHGDEPPATAQQLRNFCVIKAFRIGDPSDLDAVARYPAAAYLLDARVPGRRGGTGATFELLAADCRPL